MWVSIFTLRVSWPGLRGPWYYCYFSYTVAGCQYPWALGAWVAPHFRTLAPYYPTMKR